MVAQILTLPAAAYVYLEAVFQAEPVRAAWLKSIPATPIR